MSVSKINISPEGPNFSRIVFGAWRLCDRAETNTPEAVVERIRTAVDMGITTFDHADIYGNYAVEELFGKALKLAPELKSKIEIITKTGIKLLSDARTNHKIKSYDCSKEHIEWSVDNSLKMLGVDKIDCLLLHRPDYMMDPEEVASAFDSLRSKGKVLSFGVSNHSVSQMELLQSCLKFPLVTNQVELNPYAMDALDNGVLDHCLQKKISPMAWSPLGGGRLFTETTEQTKRIVGCFNEIASRRDFAEIGPEHVATAWLLAHPSKILPVIGTANIDRLKSYSIAEQIKLTREEWYEVWQAAQGCEVP